LTLLLARHGETPYNAENRYQGQRDVPLSETGRAQAIRLGARLGVACAAAHASAQAHPRFPGPPVAVYTSDLQRASETAALIVTEMNAGANAPPSPLLHFLPDLRERDFGAWEGLTREEIGARFPGETEPRDAESWPAVWERMNGALAFIYQSHHAGGDAVVLVVGHGGSLRAFLCHALGVGHEHVRRFRLDNASLSIIELWGDSVESGEGRVVLLNDTAHLFSALI
jgi:broad specificity phosphatase PhoE